MTPSYGPDTPFTPDTPDDELVSTVDRWVAESRSWHDVVLLLQNMAVRYHLGDQTDREDIPPYNSDTVYNRVFEATETLVPIVTGPAHQFLAVPGEDSELAIQRAQKLQKVLSRKYEDLEIQRKLENVTRDIVLKRFGVAKWCWDLYADDVDVKVVDPRLILIPKLRLDANDPSLPYVIEVQEYTRGEIEMNFPGVKPDELVCKQPDVLPGLPLGVAANAPVFQVLEVTTNECKVWKQDDRVLKKIRNPYFDWDGVEEQTERTDAAGRVKKYTYRRYLNHLPFAQKEYVFFNPFTTGDAPVAETSLAEVAIPIQDDINTQKRQIINNLVRMGNGQVYVDSDAMPQELVDQITSEPGLILQGKGLASENRIRREPGAQLPSGHFANLQESIAAFDNVMGLHGATRGASQGGTLGGQILNRQQDLSRVEMLTRCLNRGVARLADGLVQLMRLFYDAEHVVPILGPDGALEFIKFTRRDIDDGVRIETRSGTPVALDPVGRHNQAIQMWQLGAIDPETLFERLDYPDPQGAARKLQAWQQGQLLFKSELAREEAAAGAQAKAAAAPAEAGRDVETPDDVLGRAVASTMGTGAAPLSNTPNGGNPLAVA